MIQHRDLIGLIWGDWPAYFKAGSFQVGESRGEPGSREPERERGLGLRKVMVQIYAGSQCLDLSV